MANGSNSRSSKRLRIVVEIIPDLNATQNWLTLIYDECPIEGSSMWLLQCNAMLQCILALFFVYSSLISFDEYLKRKSTVL